MPPGPPFRAEHVGSFLRPERLLAAAREVRAGTMAAERFGAVQDDCVREVVRLQEALGLPSISDGECGFSSVAGSGQPLTADDQRRKLTRVLGVADAVWGTR